MKKLLSALSACVMMMLSFCIPVSAEEREPITDCEMIKKIVPVVLAEHFPPNAFVWHCQTGPDGTTPHIALELSMIYKGTELADWSAQFYKYMNDNNVHCYMSCEQAVDAGVYAEAQESPQYYALGDLDDNEAVTLNDALAALRGYASGAASGETGLTEAQGYAADVDGNGEVSLDDAQHILRYYTLNTLGQRNVGWVDIVVFGA